MDFSANRLKLTVYASFICGSYWHSRIYTNKCKICLLPQDDPVANQTPRYQDIPALSYDEKVIPALDKHKEKDPFLDEVSF